MLLYHFSIPWRLPSYNEYDNLIKRNKFAANRFKQEIEAMIMLCMPSIKDTITEEGLLVDIVWHEPNRKRDLDNIVFCKKFIFDALQKKGIIKNDKQILHLREQVPRDKKNWWK